MEKQNQNCRKKYDKAERKRLYDMVNLAYENDPRILAERARDNLEREAKKQAKKDAKAAKYKDADDSKKE